MHTLSEQNLSVCFEASTYSGEPVIRSAGESVHVIAFSKSCGSSSCGVLSLRSAALIFRFVRALVATLATPTELESSESRAC